MKVKTILSGLLIFLICFIASSSCSKDQPKQDMVLVPAGDFMMGCNKAVDMECESDEKPYHKVYLDEFYIDKYEVTNEQYQLCVNVSRCRAAHYDDGSCWRTDSSSSNNWNQGVVSQEFRGGTNPVVCIDWSEAKTYCEYAGKRLPTEAEWEKAARGTDGRKYPWGNQSIASGQYGNFVDESAKRKYSGLTIIVNGYDDGYAGTAPVGSFPLGVSPYGAMDMAGNVSEWCADWIDLNYYKNSPRLNPRGPLTGPYRSVRGGSWDFHPKHLRSALRGRNYIVNRLNNTGFRCAKTP